MHSRSLRLHSLWLSAARAIPKEARPCSARTARRTLATSSQTSKQPSESKADPSVETFSAPSRPREYYTRPKPRDLPPLQRRWPALLAFGVVGVGAWATFYAFATNQEKLSSSVVRQLMETVRASPELRDLLGDAIRPEPVWWLNGDPIINGSIYLLQGNVDVSFRVKGSKGSGTLYFTSIRKAKGEPFTILRFKVIADDGSIVNLPLADAYPRN